MLGPLVPGAIVRGPSVRDGRPCLYLTVDDGPTPESTPRWLDALDRHSAGAVFFLSGERADAHPNLVRDIVARGHRVGSHGFAHVSGWRQRPASVRADVDRAGRRLAEVTGRPIRDVRPPYGRVTPTLVRWAQPARRIVLWDVMPGDFLATRPPERLAHEILQLARPGSILTLHDGPPTTRALAALDLALPRLVAAGWTFPVLPAP